MKQVLRAEPWGQLEKGCGAFLIVRELMKCLTDTEEEVPIWNALRMPLTALLVRKRADIVQN